MSRKRGFTLIELLVVVAIIALLIAILLPSLGKAKRLASNAKCQANVRGLAIAIKLYTEDYRAMFGYDGNAANFWVNQLNKYTDVNKLRLCPEAKDLPSGEGAGGVHNPWYGGVAGNDPKTSKPYTGSYAINGWIEDPKVSLGYANQQGGGADASWFWKFPMQERDSDAPLIGDGMWFDGWPRVSSAPNTSSSPPAPANYDNHIGRWQLNRHDMKINLSFGDGHGESVELRKLWAISWHRRVGDSSVGEQIKNPLPTVPK